jgi:hypothetical protein
MKKLSTLLMVIAVYSVTTIYASDESQEEKNQEDKSIDQMLASLKMEKIQADLLIEAMARRGKLDSDQVSHAKREVASIKEEDVQDLKAQAIERLSSKNSYATK